jgi:NADPH-dependent 2,4-dienoyl-CoA reductase/sulfur reductase-like enzyme/nitrite reductase/ring-hydroxylating ferredoxin subunit
MTDSTARQGPDLLHDGVALDDLADGVMLLGHAAGKSVLIVRTGTGFLAASAKCTHYGGPLDKGLLVGDTVHCPWHHACFNLRTGEALRPPALNPLASWKVELRDGRAYVTDRHKPAPLAPAVRPLASGRTTPAVILIVGAGGAGNAAAEMLRREGYRGRLTMIDSDPDAPYDRPALSKSYLAAEPADTAAVALRPAGFHAEHGIQLVRGSVDRIEPGSRRVRLADGRLFEYEALLLATGCEPRRLDIPGHELPHVHVLRSFADSQAISLAARQARQAVVLGASFIGLEVAASLRRRGVAVHVAAPDEQPLARVMGKELGLMIRQLHEEQGVIFHLQRTAARIEPDAVLLDDGQRLEADLVVAGIGVKPRLDLAGNAGLELDNGVLVDEYLETSVPGIFAAGDIARWPDPHTGEKIRVEHWVLAERHGQAAARNMLGAREPFTGVPFFWSQHYGLSIRYTGHTGQWDRLDISGDVAARNCSVAFRLAGRTLAVASVKRDLENLEAEAKLERDDEAALQRLIPA